MNTPLIVTPHQIGSETVQAVDARELHEFLEVATPFRDWIIRRISTYGFAEGSDFHAELRESPGGRPSREYYISVTMAKELSMVERGEKGKQARVYFLECERRVKAAAQPVHAALNDPHTLRRLLSTQADRVIALEHEAAARAPQVLAFERLAHAMGAVCFRDAAKLLNLKEAQLKAWLVDHQWVYRARADGRLQAFAKRLDEGFLIHVMVPITHRDGRQSLQPQAKVTGKGLARIAELLERALRATPPMPIHSSPY